MPHKKDRRRETTAVGFAGATMPHRVALPRISAATKPVGLNNGDSLRHSKPSKTSADAPVSRKGRPKMYENRARVCFECEADLADWLTDEAKTWHLSRSQLLEKLAREFRERIERENEEDAAEADRILDDETDDVTSWEDFKRELGSSEPES